MSDVFISYAREDREFARRLVAALEKKGKTSWIDLEGIEPSDDWWQSVREAVDSADAIVFLASPDSLASETCGREIQHAADRNKRLIAVVCRDIEDLAVPAAVADVNWISLRPEDDWDAGLAKLERALALDLDLVRVHTKVLTRAEAWELAGQRASPLLRGEELRAAEVWLARAAAGAQPQPTELQAAFVAASRRAATKRQRLAIGGALGVAALAIGLSVFAFIQRSDAQDQAQIAHSRELAARAEAQLGTDPETSLALAAQAVKARPTPQAVHSLSDALTTSRLRADLRGPSPVHSVAFSPDGRLLVVGSADGAVRMWRLRDRRLLWTEGGRRPPVESLAFSARGDLLAVSRSATLPPGPQGCSVELLQARTGADRGALGAPGAGSCSRYAAFLGTSRLVAIATDTGTVQFWNVDGRTSLGRPAQVLAGTDLPLSGIAVTRDGQKLALFGLHRVEVIDLRNGRKVADVTTAPSGIFNPFGIAFDPSGSELLIDGEYGTEIYYLGGPTTADLYAQDGSTQGGAWSPDGRLLAAGAGLFGIDVWSSSSRLVEVLRGGSAQAFVATAFSSTGLLAGGSEDGSVRVWSPDLDHPDSAMHPPAGIDVGRAAAAPGGGFFAVGDAATGVALVDVKGHTLRTLRPHGDGPFAVAREELAFTRHGRLMLWSLPAGRLLRTWDSSSTAAPTSVVVSADGEAAAVLGQNGKITLFTSSDGVFATTVPRAFGTPSMSMSFDARLLAVAEKSGIRIFDTQGGLRRIRDEPGIAAVFAPSGRLLAVQRPGGSIDLLDTRSWRVRATARAEPVGIANLAFSPDDRLLAEMGSDGVLRTWDASDGTLVGTRRVIESSLQAQRVSVGPVVLTATGTALVGNGADGTLDGYDVCSACLDAKALLDRAKSRLALIAPVTVP